MAAGPPGDWDWGGRDGGGCGVVKRAVVVLKGADREMDEARRRVGLFVFDEFFAGDEKLVKSRYPWKPMTYREMKKRAAAQTSWNELAIMRVAEPCK